MPLLEKAVDAQRDLSLAIYGLEKALGAEIGNEACGNIFDLSEKAELTTEDVREFIRIVQAESVKR